MSNLLQLQNGMKSFGGRNLFSNAGFSINKGEHVGVIGPNGAGKTTLFRVLTGEEELDSGEIVTARNLRLGYLAQHDHWKKGITLEEYLDSCSMPIWDLKALGGGLGLDEEKFHVPIDSLSGGYRMRCKLLKLIGDEPELLLLDEPTNYLDLESLIVLERFLQGFRGAFLLISHDREFLRRTTDHILEVEAGEMTKYNGSLDDYFEQKEMLREQLAARAMSVEAKRREVLAFVSRFGAKATKAKQAQSRLKSLNRLEKIEIKALPTSARIRLPEPQRTGKQILEMKDVTLGYGDKTVLSSINFALLRGDHLGVVGVNGAGKSTFLKACARVLEPLSGKINSNPEVSIGYYAQHVAEALDGNDTVLEAISWKADKSVSRQETLDLAGSLLFSNDDMKKKIKVLSGGEKSRVALGQILLRKSPCLVLDEPTNHLDFQTVEALTLALKTYKGTVVVVSHDRSFISRTATKILEIHDGIAEIYYGSYDEYVWSVQNGSLSKRRQEEKNKAPIKVEQKEEEVQIPVGNYKQLKKDLEKSIRKNEKKMETLTEEIDTLTEKLNFTNEKLTESGGETSQVLSKILKDTQDQVATCEETWLKLEEELSADKAKLERLTSS